MLLQTTEFAEGYTVPTSRLVTVPRSTASPVARFSSTRKVGRNARWRPSGVVTVTGLLKSEGKDTFVLPQVAFAPESVSWISCLKVETIRFAGADNGPFVLDSSESTFGAGTGSGGAA